MAKVLKQQESLSSAFKKKAGLGLGFVVSGVVILIFFTQLGIVGVILIISGIVLIGRGHKFQLGATGESLVTKVLSDFPEDWYIFNDMIVAGSQIDHIVVCPKGIYTIETKNYQGTIYGNAKKPEWYQVINYDYKTPFYNPVKQGNGHSLSLSKYLEKIGLKKIWVNTIVVFTEPSVELKVFSPKIPVIYLSELKDFLNKEKQVMNTIYCNKIADCVSKLIPAKDNKALGKT